MRHANWLTTLAATLMSAVPVVATAAPDVVVSIKPVHALVAAIMGDVGKPVVMIEGSASPHTYQMKPSDAGKLQDADIIFWVGHDMEKFMEKPLESVGTKARIVELNDAPGLVKLAPRESGTFEPHADDDHAHAGHEHEGEEEEVDPHVWLNTANAKVMAAEIEKTLAEADPANSAAYAENLAALNARLDTLATDIKAILAPVKDRPIIVFHDAYQYYEAEFGINVAGSITVSPENVPGAARISEIHAKVKSLNSTCVFAEPQFEPKLIKVVLEGTDARTGTLDPEAGMIEAGPDLYATMMTGIATSIRDCLSK